MKFKFNIKSFTEFFNSGSNSGIVLLCCVAISLLIANSSFSTGFSQALNYNFGIETSWLHLKYSTLNWINDGLMAVFFLLVGLEIKRELVEGELSSFSRATLPLFAALGGAIVPAVIFFAFNMDRVSSSGWGIPMATDIAFALGILSLLRKKVPPSTRIFLAALAVADDVIAIIVIAFFYSTDINVVNLMIASGLLAGLIVLNRFEVTKLWAYLIPGMLVWYFIHHSGVHATIAGVLVAATIPTNKVAVESPLEKLEHRLTTPVNFIIMPIFALANTNITLNADMFGHLSSALSLGIILGLVIGKPIGISLMTFLMVKFKLGSLPRNAGWNHILGLGMLGGIGFTMSIFISFLSFSNSDLQSQAKLAILIASITAAIAGLTILSRASRKTKKVE